MRAGVISVCLAALAGCSSPVAAPPVATGVAPLPAIVVPSLSDGDAVPLAVIQNLPQGVSATSVSEDGGCFSYTAAGQNLPVVNGNGIQICRG